MRLWEGRSSEVRRVIIYLAIGAVISVENLVSVLLLSRQHVLHYVAYIVLAQEISILFSFFLNDRFTFGNLHTVKRVWYVRCLRFHGVAALSGIVIVSISTLLHYLRFTPLVAQSVAIGFTTVANFVVHRFWTYRSPRHAPVLIPHDVATVEQVVETAL